jgi:hypothetical protein
MSALLHRVDLLPVGRRKEYQDPVRLANFGVHELGKCPTAQVPKIGSNVDAIGP